MRDLLASWWPTYSPSCSVTWRRPRIGASTGQHEGSRPLPQIQPCSVVSFAASSGGCQARVVTARAELSCRVSLNVRRGAALAILPSSLVSSDRFALRFANETTLSARHAVEFSGSEWRGRISPPGKLPADLRTFRSPNRQRQKQSHLLDLKATMPLDEKTVKAAEKEMRRAAPEQARPAKRQKAGQILLFKKSSCCRRSLRPYTADSSAPLDCQI